MIQIYDCLLIYGCLFYFYFLCTFSVCIKTMKNRHKEKHLHAWNMTDSYHYFLPQIFFCDDHRVDLKIFDVILPIILDMFLVRELIFKSITLYIDFHDVNCYNLKKFKQVWSLIIPFWGAQQNFKKCFILKCSRV